MWGGRLQNGAFAGVYFQQGRHTCIKKPNPWLSFIVNNKLLTEHDKKNYGLLLKGTVASLPHASPSSAMHDGGFEGPNPTRAHLA